MHKILSFKIAAISVATVCLLLLPTTTPAQTIGGANRRVVATGGYGGVTVDFVEPDSFTIHHAGTNWNAHRSHPDIYVGTSFPGRAEIDAGVSWQQYKQNEEVRGVTVLYPPTWMGFVRVNDVVKTAGDNGQQAIRLSNGRQYRVSKGRLGAFRLTGRLEPNGYYRLFINSVTGGSAASNAFRVDWSKNGTFTPGLVAGMQVKRVVALTQSDSVAGNGNDLIYGVGGRELNVLGTEVTSAEVARVRILNNKRQVAIDANQNWSQVAQKKDEFIPSSRNANAAGNNVGPWVIDLRAPHQRQGVAGVPANRPGVFNDEIVDIRMIRRPQRARLWGNAAAIGGRQ